MTTEIHERISSDTRQHISLLYKSLLECWNNQDARGFANLFAHDGSIIGFDGSQANGKEEIYEHLSGIFSNHKTASFISITREIRFLGEDVAILRGVAGMVPPGEFDINPAVNAVQTLVVQNQKGQFRIAVFQNTPAAFNGRPEASEQLTKELREALNVKI
jgi:uncharacterized protein (TIGR02246 family)